MYFYLQIPTIGYNFLYTNYLLNKVKKSEITFYGSFCICYVFPTVKQILK